MKKKTALLILAFILLGVFAQSCEKKKSGITIKKNVNDQNITFIVSVKNAPNKVHALGFEVIYDPLALKYVRYKEGKSVREFQMFGAHKVKEGLVRVGGFAAGEKSIKKDASGELVILEFEWINSEQKAGITLAKLLDDISGWNPQE